MYLLTCHLSLIITARIRRMGKVMFSVCPHLGGGGQVQAGGGSGPAGWGEGGQVSPAGRGGSGPGGGVGGSGPAGGRGGVRSSRPGGRGVRSVQRRGGGVSASCALLQAVCLLRSRRRTFLFRKCSK